MYTVYTYWNSEGVIAVLNAIAMIMGTGDYLGLLRTFAIAGMLVAVGVGLVKISAKEPMQYFVFLGLFYFGLFVPKVTVDVVDVQTGGVGTVANVPFGVAFFYSSSSKIGKFLTETYETTFQPVENLRFGKTGLVFGARAFQEVAGARSGDPRLSDALREFTRGCINPEVIEDTTKYEGLVKAVNIWTYINTSPGGSPWLNPARSVYIPIQGSGSYEYVACQGTGSAYEKLTAWITAEATNQQSWIARKLFPDKATPSTGWGTATAAIAAALADNEGYLLAISRSAADQIKQGMIANAIADSAGSLAAARNDPSAMQASLAAKMAEMQANGAYRSMALIGEAALPKFRNIVEIVIISVFPIVMLLIVMAGERGGAVLKTYVVTTIWIQLWAPLYAIVNFMMLGGMSSRLQAALEGATSQTMMNTAGLTMVAFKEASLAGSLVFAVPVIAYALVKGGEVAMSGAMSGLTGQASGAAASQGGAAATGQVSFGNGSWGNQSSNNMSANKWDTGGSMTQGGMSMNNGGVLRSGDLGSAMGGSGLGTGRVSMAGVTSDMGGMTAMASASFGSTAQSAYTTSMRQGSDAITQLSSSIGSGLQRSTGMTARSGSSSDVSATWQSGGNTSNGATFDKALTDSVKFGNGAGFSAAESVQLAAAASAGTGAFSKMAEKLAGASNASPAIKGMAGKLAKAASVVGADIDAGVKADAGIKQTYDAARQAGDSEAFKGSLSKAMTSTAGTGASNTSSAGTERSSGTTSSYAEAVTAQNTARDSFQRASDLSTTISNMKQGGGQVGASMAAAALKDLGTAGFIQMFSPGNEQAAGAYLTGLAQQQVQSMGGGFTPQQGSAPQAGGAQGAATAANVNSAVGGTPGGSGSGQPPGWTPGQVDAVQIANQDNNAVVGRGPSSTPGPVSGPGGAKTTAGGVKAGAEGALKQADGDLGVASARVEGNVNGVRQEATGAINDANKAGGLVGNAGATMLRQVTPGKGKGDVRDAPSMRTGDAPDWRSAGGGKRGGKQ